MNRITLFTLLLVATTAFADNKHDADTLFKQGKKLMEQKRYAEACASFEKSMKLDPVIGAQLNVAKCYEEWHKLGAAYNAYKVAEKMAHDAGDKREPDIHDLVQKLEPDVPRLTVKLPAELRPDQVKVTLDNQPFSTFNEAVVVDPGPHMVEYFVQGSTHKQNQVVPIEKGGKQEVVIEAPKAKTVTTEPTKPVEEPVKSEAPTGRNQRIAGIAVAGGGLVAIAISTIMTVSAKHKYSDALDMYCGGMTNNCDMTGLQITHEARTTANQATVVFILGAALVGGGVALYLLAPKAKEPAADEQAIYLAPSIGPSSAGVVLGGRL